MKTAAMVAVLLLFGACEAPPEAVQPEQVQTDDEIRDEITNRWVSLRDAVFRKDFDAWVTHWTPDMRALGPGADWSGDGFFDVMGATFASSVQYTTLDVQSYEVFVHGNHAYQIAEYDVTFQMPEQEPEEVQDYIFVRWEKQSDGVWRISRFVAAPRNAPTEG